MNELTVAALILIGASAIALIPATLARSKGRSFFAWWLVSILLLGIFAVILVALLPTYRCPECREVIRPDARLCPHCRTELEPGSRRGPRADSADGDGELVAFIAVGGALAVATTVGLPWLAVTMDDGLPLWAGLVLGTGLGAVFTCLYAVTVRRIAAS